MIAFADRVSVDRARQRRLEADDVRPTLDRVDVVRERVHVLDVALVPLERDLDLDAVARALQIDDVGMDRRLRLVQMLDERDDAALVEELVRLLVALVRMPMWMPRLRNASSRRRCERMSKLKRRGLEDRARRA
jgi:hypothetical protein